MGKTKPGDWLATRKEPGQSFRQYIYSSPAIPNKRRKVIYIQPIGPFTEDERKIVKKTAKYLNIFYGLPVITQKDLKRFQKLIKFCKENDLKDEQQFYTKSLKTLQTSSTVNPHSQ